VIAADGRRAGPTDGGAVLDRCACQWPVRSPHWRLLSGEISGRVVAAFGDLACCWRHVLPRCRSVIVWRPFRSSAWSVAHRIDQLGAAPSAATQAVST
jgi:hypothetical protein